MNTPAVVKCPTCGQEKWKYLGGDLDHEPPCFHCLQRRIETERQRDVSRTAFVRDLQGLRDHITEQSERVVELETALRDLLDAADALDSANPWDPHDEADDYTDALAAARRVLAVPTQPGDKQ